MATEPVAPYKATPQRRYDRDKASPVWDMSQERVFLETLLNQRFGFFVVFFGVVIAGAANAKVQQHLTIILTLGFVIELLLWPLIYRAQYKLDLIVEYLTSDESHPMTIIDEEVGKKTKGFARLMMHPWIRHNMIGRIVPLV